MARSVIGALRVVLGLDSAQFESGIKRVSRSNQQLVRNTQVAANAVRGLASALGVVSVGAAARGFLSLTDQSKQLTAQLRLATAQSGNFAQAQADVQRIASSARAGLKETADLYGAFARNAGELGINQEQVARITETVSQSFKISGASAAETAGATRQLVQAFQSGVLRGEEFNSVMENAPRLARLLAESLGVPISSLRAMAEEGDLTADKLARAFSDQKFTDRLDAEFRQLPVTFEEAMQQVHNAAVITFGEFDRGGGFSQALANFVIDGQSGFADLGDSARELGIEIRSVLAGLSDVFEPMLDGAMHAFGMIDNEAKSLTDRLTAWMGEVDAVSGWAGKQGLGGRLLTGGSVGDWWNGRPTRGTTLLNDFSEGQARSERSRRRQLGEDDLNAMLGGRDVLGNRIGGPVGGSSGAGGKKGGGKKGPSAETLRKRAETEARRAADALRRFTDTIAREEADLAESLAELSGDTSALADARMQQVEADRAARQRDIEADDSLDDAKRQQLIHLNDESAAVQRRLVRKEEIEAELEKQDRIAIAGLDLEMELLSLTGDLARSAAGQRDVELRILDMAFERERLELEGIKARNAVNSAEWQIADARLKQLGSLQGGATQQVISRTQGPLEGFLDSLPRTADEAREALERVQTDGINGLIDGLAMASTNVKSLGDMFKNVANQIIQDLVRIQLQKALVGTLGKILNLGGALGGAGGGIIGGDGSNMTGAITRIDTSSLPGFNTGGGFKVGGMPGVDRNIVSFKASRGEMVDIRKPGNQSSSTVQVVPSPYFNVVVDGQIMTAAPAIAQAGGQIGMANMAQRNTRRVG